MTDTFDAVLAELQQPETLRLHMGEMTPYEVMIAQAAVRFAHSRLAAAHAAEKSAWFLRAREEAERCGQAEARAEAAASGQGVEGWTIQVKRGGPDDELGIWAVAPDGSSIWLAPTPERAGRE